MTVCTGPRTWMLAETTEPSARLLELAIAATTWDGDAVPVLDDAMQIEGWNHDAILPMLFGVELAPPIPHFSNVHQRGRFNAEYERAHKNANDAGAEQRGRSIRWARAVLAAMLFGAWPHATRLDVNLHTRSPFAVVRSLQRRLRREGVDLREPICECGHDRSKHEGHAGACCPTMRNVDAVFCSCELFVDRSHTIQRAVSP